MLITVAHRIPSAVHISSHLNPRKYRDYVVLCSTDACLVPWYHGKRKADLPTARCTTDSKYSSVLWCYCVLVLRVMLFRWETACVPVNFLSRMWQGPGATLVFAVGLVLCRPCTWRPMEPAECIQSGNYTTSETGSAENGLGLMYLILWISVRPQLSS
jgi:hypothetical protein